MSAITPPATSIPGVRSSSISTCSGATAIRAACSNSSRRWADSTLPRASSNAHATINVPLQLARNPGSVVVGRISIDRVDVIHVALRRIFDHESRALHAEVCGAAVGSGAAPRKVRVAKIRADLRHARLCERIVDDADPFADQLPEHRLLRGRERRRANALGLNRAAVLPGAEH